MSTKAYLNDEGTALILDVGTDITGATDVSIAVKKQSGAEESWGGEIYQNTKIKYVVEFGDFSEAGKYLLNAKVTTASGTWTGETTSFIVYRDFM